jgi:hypothetical protein
LEIQENEGIDEEKLPEELQRLRPDMMFERRKMLIPGELRFYRERHEEELRNEERVREIIEFSCPYGRTSQGRNTPERVYEEKKRKYMTLARTLKQLRRYEV